MIKINISNDKAYYNMWPWYNVKEMALASIIFLPTTHHASFIIRKTGKQIPTDEHSARYLTDTLQNGKVIQNKRSLRNCLIQDANGEK